MHGARPSHGSWWGFGGCPGLGVRGRCGLCGAAGLASGVNPKIVSERLGRHSTAFTLDTYAHVIPGMQRRAAQDLTDLVLGPTGDVTTDTARVEDDVLPPSDEES